MSFSALLSGYANSKSQPPVEVKKVTITPKPHPLKEVLTNIRLETKPTPIVADSDRPIQRNLGILVTIIDDFPNELLWRLWLNKANADNTFEETPCVRMWFHAKCPEKVRSPWVRERLIRSAHFKPEWGSIEITKAMAHMLHEALFDAPHINKFCFASESCIPIRSLSDTLDIIYSSNGTSTDIVNDFVNSSWLNYSHIPNNGYAKQLQHDPLSRALPDGCVYKASQWVMLSRAHAVAVIELMQQVGQRVSSPSNTTSGSKSSSNQHSTDTRSDNSGNSGENSNETVDTATTTEGLPLLSNALFRAFQLVGKASDEMFFPSCLAVVGAIEPYAVEGETSNSNTAAASQSNTNPTAATTTTTANITNADTVYKQQITYCDWTDNAKSPQEYLTFPTALVTALTHYKHYTATAKNKKLLETLHIHPQQQYACFLRKIKFPMDKGRVKEDALCEMQMKFLSDWLPFVVENSAASSSETGDITAATTATDDIMSVVDTYMQQAQILCNQIASYPAPEKVIKKRPLVEEHSDSYSRSNSHNGNDNDSRYSSGYNYDRYGRDGRNSNDYSNRQGETSDRSYGHNNEYRNDNNNHSSGGYRQGNDRYDRNYSNDRSRDYRDNYANKSSRYY